MIFTLKLAHRMICGPCCCIEKSSHSNTREQRILRGMEAEDKSRRIGVGIY